MEAMFNYILYFLISYNKNYQNSSLEKTYIYILDQK
jgi:hypothetical protein